MTVPAANVFGGWLSLAEFIEKKCWNFEDINVSNFPKALNDKSFGDSAMKWEGSYARIDPKPSKGVKKKLTFLVDFGVEKTRCNSKELLNIFLGVQFEWGTANEGD